MVQNQPSNALNAVVVKILVIFAWAIVCPAWADGEVDAAACAELLAKLDRNVKILHARMEAQGNPFGGANAFNIKEIARTHVRVGKEVPEYGPMNHLQPGTLTDEESALLGKAVTRVNSIASNPESSPYETTGAIELARKIYEIHGYNNKAMTAEAEELPEPPKKVDEAEPKKEEKPKPPPPPPRWDDDDDDDYKPKNDRSESGGSNDTNYLAKYSVPAPRGLLPSRYYDEVTEDSVLVNAAMRPERVRHGVSTPVGTMILHPYGKHNIRLPSPYGVEPIAKKTKDYEVRPDPTAPGEMEFIWTGKGEVPERVEIELEDDKGRAGYQFNTKEGALAYAKPTKIDPTLWPEQIQNFVADIKKRGIADPLHIADRLAKFMNNNENFRYYADHIPEAELNQADAYVAARVKQGIPKFVALAESKLFQCDGAGPISTILLRDFFQIPARVVAGRTVGTGVREDGKNWNAIRSGDPKHMWFEVWNHGEWVPFDSQPHKPESGEKSHNPEEYSPDTGVPPSHDDSGQQAKQPRPEDLKKLDDKDGEKVPDKDGKAEESEDAEAGDDDIRVDARELRPNLDLLNSLKNNPTPTEEDGLRAIMEVVELFGLESALMGGNKVEKLTEAADRLHALADSSPKASTAAHESRKRMQEQIMTQTDYLQKSMTDSVAQIRYLAGKGEFRKAWKALKELDTTIKNLNKRRHLTTAEMQMQNQIRRTLTDLRRINHKDAVAYDAAERIWNALPGGFSREFITQKYGNVLELGSQALANFTADLKAGKLNRLVRMAYLQEYVRLVMHSKKESTIEKQKTLDRDPITKNSEDIVLANSIYEFDRMLLNLRPGRPIFADLFEGKQFALGNKQTRETPGFKEPIERKISIIYMDISPSMNGDRLEVQETLTAAFLDHALSDMDKFGRPLHEVHIVPFHSSLEPGTWYKTAEQARAKVFHHLNGGVVPQTKGGTDIQAAMVNFYDTVAKSYTDGTIPGATKLRHANCIIYSDGGSTVDYKTVLDARQQVPSDVGLKLNFIGVGGGNKDIEQVAASSNLTNTKPMVHILPDGAITTAAHVKDLGFDKDAFATTVRAGKQPEEVTLDLNQLGRLQPVDFATTVDMKWVSQEFDRIGKDDDLVLVGVEKERTLAIEAAVKKLVVDERYPTALREQITAAMVANIPRIVGRPIHTLHGRQWAALRALMDWVHKEPQ